MMNNDDLKALYDAWGEMDDGKEEKIAEAQNALKSTLNTLYDFAISKGVAPIEAVIIAVNAVIQIGGKSNG